MLDTPPNPHPWPGSTWTPNDPPIPSDQLWDAQGLARRDLSPAVSRWLQRVQDEVHWPLARRTADEYVDRQQRWVSLCERRGAAVTDMALCQRWLWSHAIAPAGRSWNASALRTAQAAIACLWGFWDYGTPTLSGAWRRWFRGLLRHVAAPPQQASPMTLAHLKTAMATAAQDSNGLRGLRDSCLVLLGWCGGLRLSELIALDVGDLDSYAGAVSVRQSKGDQLHHGAMQPLVRSRTAGLDPVQQAAEWIAAARLETGPLLRPLTAHGRVLDRRLSPSAVRLVLGRLLPGAGLSSHSMRSGLLSYLDASGMSLSGLQAFGRHRTSSTTHLYLRHAEDLLEIE